jgi:hypothetical protein
MNILLWHVHGSWTTAFVQGRHTYLVPVMPGRRPDGRGRARTWDWPTKVVERTPAQLRHDDVDVVVLQRPEDEAFATAWLGRRPGRDVAAVWLEHNAPQGRLADMRHPAADQDDLIVVHVTYTNALFWDCGRTETRVIDALEADVGRITGWGDHLALSSWAAGGCWPVATGGVQPRPSTSRRSSLGATATSANRSALSPSTPRRAP